MFHKGDLRQLLIHGKAVLKWLALGCLVGVLGGLLGAAFHHLLHFVTHVRGENPWLIYLLPVGGLLTVGLYRVLKLRSNRGTNEIIEAALDGHALNPFIAPGIVAAAGVTHLFGGSAGREGAALQLGGSAASQIAKVLKLEDGDRKLMIMAGMSAVFAGLFGTPLTAAMFCMEFEAVGMIFSPAVLPCFVSAYTASRVSALLGVHGEGYLLTQVYPLTLENFWQYALLALLISGLGILMCRVFHAMERLMAHRLPNLWLRIFLGGAVLAALTVLVGDQRYNGAGMDMALGAVAGKADWFDFALKLLFTAITLGAGFKGGEIVPTFCIGATFGCIAGTILGLDAGFAAALGLVGLFCCATNAPLASILLSIEMFGGGNVAVFALTCALCFAFSGTGGLYASQQLPYGKDGIEN